MTRYLVTRLLWALVVLWAVLTLTFATVFMSPVDPARSYAGSRAPAEVVEQVRVDMGLDQPLAVQYGRYVGRVVRGDLGESYATGTPVTEALASAMPATIELAVAAILVEVVLGLSLGVAAALWHRGAVDRGVLGATLLGVATPPFVLGILLLYVFAFELGWFPIGGRGSPEHLVMPALTVGVAGAAWLARMVRSSVLTVLEEDHVTFARAKGLRPRSVLAWHVLRNAAGPAVTLIGLDIGVFLGGVLVVEQVFDWPGIGQLAWRAISYNDIPVVMGAVLVAATCVTLVNLVADLVNAALDPRVRLR